jgi:hypothetical protein
VAVRQIDHYQAKGSKKTLMATGLVLERQFQKAIGGGDTNGVASARCKSLREIDRV